jgi:type IV pilus assembly protein PilW
MSRQLRRMTRQRGFSLVELMVALTLSLLLLAGALSILYSSKLTNTENERLARLQEAGRTVLELMLRDARAAGYQGCSRPVYVDQFVNGLSSAGTLLWNLALPLEGYDAASGAFAPGVGSPALDAAVVPSATAGSDIVAFRTTRQGQPLFRTTAAIKTVPELALALQVTRNAGTTVPAGTPMVVGDCSGSSVFMATSFTTTSGTTATIEHVTGDGTTGNVDGDLARGGFDVGALVMPMQTVIYYVRDSATAGVGPTLWQRVGSADPQELIQGVENMQFTYGVDTDGDLLVNDYRLASAVTDWNQVVSLTLAVLIRSPEEAGVERDNRTYNLLGTDFGPFNDRRQRAVFTTTVVLRNRTT